MTEKISNAMKLLVDSGYTIVTPDEKLIKLPAYRQGYDVGLKEGLMKGAIKTNTGMKIIGVTESDYTQARENIDDIDGQLPDWGGLYAISVLMKIRESYQRDNGLNDDLKDFKEGIALALSDDDKK